MSTVAASPTIRTGVSRADQPSLSSGLSSVSWIPSRDIQLNEWAAVGRRLGRIALGSQWWIGDWVRYGCARWGERYTAAARITGYDVHSLRNMVWIASCFEPSRRRDNLSWSHHASIATLEPAEQDRWLDRAIAEKLSVSDLRVELRSARRSGTGGPPAPGKATVIICPQCGFEINPLTEREEGPVA
jgi:hypothetical protein